MRNCPKCNKRELDVTVPKDSPYKEYFFRCWNCGFECSKKEADKIKTPPTIIFWSGILLSLFIYIFISIKLGFPL